MIARGRFAEDEPSWHKAVPINWRGQAAAVSAGIQCVAKLTYGPVAEIPNRTTEQSLGML
jgi:hypothetical protein